jgi:putative ABC transport system permease protein
MLKNYFKVAWRNLLKYKVFSFINIFGMAVAMSVCMLVILMLADQKAYDQFHEKKDRVYRIVSSPEGSSRMRATIPFPVAGKLKSDYPIIEDAVYLRRGFGGDALYADKATNDQKFASIRGYFSTPSFFKIFSFALETGDPATALQAPNSLVISDEIAQKFFHGQSPIGKVISFSDRGLNFWTDESTPNSPWGNFTITGVFAKTQQKSHIRFDAIASASSLDVLYKEGKIENLADNWETDHQSYAYVLLKKQATESDLKTTLAQLTKLNLKTSDNEGLRKSRLTFQKLTEIIPGNATGNDTITSLPLFVYYILGGLAFVILLSAGLNYSSIAVARAITRANEIGIRKVNGAGRRDIVYQFICETMLTILLALLLAMIFLMALKSAFLHLWINQFLNFELQMQPIVYVVFTAFALLVGLIAGIFPAMRLSGFKPITALKKLDTGGRQKLGIRRVLTVAQFTISLLFIISAILIYNQFKHFNQFDYGFNPNHVLNINLQGNDFETVKNRLQEVTGVSAVAGSSYLPATGRNDNLTLKKAGTDIEKNAIDLTVTADFTNVMGIPLLAGQNLPADKTSQNFILVNETATKDFGFKQPADMVGQQYILQGKNVQVAGVIKDFTFFFLFAGRPTGAIVFHSNNDYLKFASIKIPAENRAQTMAALTAKWRSIDPVHPFDYKFYDDQLANTNRGIFDIVSIISLLAGLAITIACLGLLGLAHYIIERRTKEVGIRKVLGAGSLHLNYLLSKEFLVLLGLSILIGAPASYFINRLWLDFLIYRTEFGPATILTGSLLLLVLGLLTIIPQTIKMINRNPVEVLKVE